MNTYQVVVSASAAIVASLVVGASYRSTGGLEIKALLIMAGIFVAAAMFYTMLGDKD